MGNTAGTVVVQGATAEISRLPGTVAIDFVVVADAIARVEISGRDVAEAHRFVGIDCVFRLGNLCNHWGTSRGLDSIPVPLICC
jgi:hypothetical protein